MRGFSCGLQHTIVLFENGGVWGFGSNQYGQLGVGDTNVRGTPSRMRLRTPIVQVACGGNHTVLLAANGQVYTCGHRVRMLCNFIIMFNDSSVNFDSYL